MYIKKRIGKVLAIVLATIMSVSVIPETTIMVNAQEVAATEETPDSDTEGGTNEEQSEVGEEQREEDAPVEESTEGENSAEETSEEAEETEGTEENENIEGPEESEENDAASEGNDGADSTEGVETETEITEKEEVEIDKVDEDNLGYKDGAFASGYSFPLQWNGITKYTVKQLDKNNSHCSLNGQYPKAKPNVCWYGKNVAYDENMTMDIAAAAGTPIYAIEDGTVVKCGIYGDGDADASGNFLVLSHSEGLSSKVCKFFFTSRFVASFCTGC